MTPDTAPDLDSLPDALRARVAQDWQEFSLLPEAPQLPERILATLPQVWACSRFVAQHCLRDRGLLADLCSRGDLERRYPATDYAQALQADMAGVNSEASLMQTLRRRRNREMVRIAWRDLAGWADLDETLGDLTRLADALIGAALNWLETTPAAGGGRREGGTGDFPRLVVLGMGKLGGGELNYSSDVDLIFAYEQRPEAPHSPVTHEERCTWLARALIRVLSERTADGFVYRVDTLLRPFGKSGALVIAFDAMERYYQTHGREWERYALIKARPVAGDVPAGERLLRSLHPFVYRRYLDYGALEALRQMKQQIESHEASKGARDDIKLGRGGIREVEFIAQLFQLIRGGHEPQLQSRNLRPVLRLLGEQGHLPAYAVAELDAAYVFLRCAENRLQAYADEQIHRLPTTAAGQAALALGMGFADWESFRQQLDGHRRKVRQHFERVFAAPHLDQPAGGSTDTLSLVFEENFSEERAREAMARHGLHDAEAAGEFLRRLRHGAFFRSLSEAGRRRLEQLLPLLLGAVQKQHHPGQALLRVWQVVEAVARRVTYLSLLVENPTALSQLVALCGASPWITQQLTLHPVLLDELLDPRTLYHPPHRDELGPELAQLASHLALEDVEAQMDVLRRFQQINMLRVAAADISGSIPLMVVSDHLTEIAEVVVSHALRVAWQQMTLRHGLPAGIEDKDRGTVAGFAVIGYGKFGGIELGYGSDLDLVFMHDSVEGLMTTGVRPLEQTAFYTRLAQKMIHLLSTRTPAGIAYEVDMELRPSGQSGLLVTGLEAFHRYQLTQAWTWEHQALARARAVAGDPALMRKFESARQEVLMQPRDPITLRADVGAMRERMAQNLGIKRPGHFDIKHGRGGMIDIEFLVQYAVLRAAHAHPELARWSDNIRQLEGLAQAGELDAGTAAFLAEAYRTYRRRVHACALQEIPGVVQGDEWHDTRTRVIALWQQMMTDPPATATGNLVAQARNRHGTQRH